MSECKCCSCEDNKELKLKQIIDIHKSTEGALIPVLHETQTLYGYLPEEALKIISKEMNISLAEVYGVVTFYTNFSLSKKGKYKINICLGTACYVKGSGQILDKLKEKLGIELGECTEDGKFSLDACRCIGACGLAPVLTINDDVHGRLTVDEVEGILKLYEDK